MTLGLDPPPADDASLGLPGLVPPPPRSRLKGRLWQSAGIVFFIIGFLLLGATGLGLMLVVFGILGVHCILRGKRHLALAATELLARDPRPPVIYLRSFLADTQAARSAEGNRFFGSAQALFDTKTTEERLVEALSVIGPVVAIGKPGEKLPALGAARMYVDDEHWQSTVHRLMDRSALVALRLGDTPGFWWELEHSISLAPTKLILIVPFNEAEYESFRERTSKHFPHPLPPFGSRIGFSSWRFRPRRGLGKLVGLIFFHPDWAPEYVDLTTIRYGWGWVPRYFGRQRLLRSLNWNLRPVLEQLAVPWQPPKVRWLLLSATGLLAFFLTVGLGAGFSDLWRGWREQSRRDAAAAAFVKATGTTPDEARRLADAGWLRLGDEVLMERAALVAERLRRVGAESCVGLVTEGEGALEPSLRWADPSITERWFAVLTQSAVAEQRQSPERTHLKPDDVREAYDLFLKEQDRFVAGPDYAMPFSISNAIIALRDRGTANAKEVLSTFESGEMTGFGFVQVSYDDACRVLVNLHHAVNLMPPPLNGRLARALAYAAGR